MKSYILLLVVIFLSTAHAQLSNFFTPARDPLLGKVLKSGLENYHFSKKKIDDQLSRDAFKLYIERLDYSKRYLLHSDVKELEKYLVKIDDQIKSGDLKLMKLSHKILKKRVQEVRDMAMKLLKKPFKFNAKEKIELDPKKRKFATNKIELREFWRKSLKFDVLNRYMDMQKEQKEEKDGKNKKIKKSKKKVKKSTKPVKKLSKKEMEEKARQDTIKSYTKIFKRKLQEDHNDELSRMFNAVSLAFDPHTSYLAPKAKEDFDIDIRGSLEGIGAVLREDGDHIKVVEIVPGSASWREGRLKPEYIILKVAQGKGEQVDIVGMRLGDAVRLIRGKKGTEVRLTVKKTDNQILIIPIVRDTVIIEEAYAKSSILKDRKSNVKFGLIDLPKFYRDFSKGRFDSSAKNCTDDVKKILLKFKENKVDGVILDLRMNGGGSLEDAVQMSGLFIKDGPIVQVKDSEGRISKLLDNDSNVIYGGPLVVLVNRFSASASEIVAGAMQDYNRGVIVGAEHTHGKGTVQSIIDLDQAVSSGLNVSSLGSIKLTISKFYRVTGSSTQYKGITPDIILPDPQDYIETGEKSMDFSLPWDEIKKTKFNKWQGTTFDIKRLAKMSSARIKVNPRFQKMTKLVSILKSKRDDTLINLNLKIRQAEIDSYIKETKALKQSDDKDLFDVVYLRYSETEKKYKKSEKYATDIKEKEEAYLKGLQSDSQLEEAMNILKDMKNMTKAYAGTH